MTREKLFNKPTKFYKSVNNINDLPDFGKTEIAFLGRSNVGKSSFINKITNEKIARTSNTPGRTQMLNFFSVNDDLDIVDMPGYGFAKAPKSYVEAWQDLIIKYLKGRPTLKRLYLLIDSRRGIMKVDEEIMNTLDKSAVSYQIIITKIDKIKEAAHKKIKDETEKKIEKHPAAFPTVLLTSSEKNIGIDEMKKLISDLIY